MSQRSREEEPQKTTGYRHMNDSITKSSHYNNISNNTNISNTTSNYTDSKDSDVSTFHGASPTFQRRSYFQETSNNNRHSIISRSSGHSNNNQLQVNINESLLLRNISETSSEFLFSSYYSETTNNGNSNGNNGNNGSSSGNNNSSDDEFAKQSITTHNSRENNKIRSQRLFVANNSGTSSSDGSTGGVELHDFRSVSTKRSIPQVNSTMLQQKQQNSHYLAPRLSWSGMLSSNSEADSTKTVSTTALFGDSKDSKDSNNEKDHKVNFIFDDSNRKHKPPSNNNRNPEGSFQHKTKNSVSTYTSNNGTTSESERYATPLNEFQRPIRTSDTLIPDRINSTAFTVEQANFLNEKINSMENEQKLLCYNRNNINDDILEEDFANTNSATNTTTGMALEDNHRTIGENTSYLYADTYITNANLLEAPSIKRQQDIQEQGSDINTTTNKASTNILPKMANAVRLTKIEANSAKVSKEFISSPQSKNNIDLHRLSPLVNVQDIHDVNLHDIISTTNSSKNSHFSDKSSETLKKVQVLEKTRKSNPAASRSLISNYLIHGVSSHNNTVNYGKNSKHNTLRDNKIIPPLFVTPQSPSTQRLYFHQEPKSPSIPVLRKFDLKKPEIHDIENTSKKSYFGPIKTLHEDKVSENINDNNNFDCGSHNKNLSIAQKDAFRSEKTHYTNEPLPENNVAENCSKNKYSLNGSTNESLLDLLQNDDIDHFNKISEKRFSTSTHLSKRHNASQQEATSSSYMTANENYNIYDNSNTQLDLNRSETFNQYYFLQQRQQLENNNEAIGDNQTILSTDDEDDEVLNILASYRYRTITPENKGILQQQGNFSDNNDNHTNDNNNYFRTSTPDHFNNEDGIFDHGFVNHEQHIDSNSIHSLTAASSYSKSPFFYTFSIRRILTILFISFWIPPFFFMIAFLLSDQRVMQMIMTDNFRKGVLKGYIWDIDIKWFRTTCLCIGSVEVLGILASIGGGIGVGIHNALH
ncbi:uncharacterized protein SCDLUD_000607 [Saccharomycodes ludwigii]|uniref:uncharacterized protein n=1 Tax=Saccharomycodes ludwigii TaxID=36035 RepID=UPI001E825C9D|nr:hypothetical protein SCDLUD_000607 [Saccharomycodes ludwigii]KAH3903003.1 hypothetical protein SCDLUD_000607 [Saccharomycodes ludwigii]